MMWIGLAAALVVAIVAQTTLCALGDLPLIDLDFPLVLVLLYGLLAPRHDARLAGLIIGFVVDLSTAGPLGVYALAYGLAALLLTKLRDVVNLQLWWGRLLIGWVAGLAGEVLITLHLQIVQGVSLGSSWRAAWLAVMISGVAALLASLLTVLRPLSPKRRLRARSSWVPG